MRVWQEVPLGEVIEQITGGKNIEAGSGTSPFRIMKVSAVTSGVFKPNEAKPAPDRHIPAPEHHVREGDFLFSRANTSELVGAVAIAHNPPDGLLLPDKVWRIEWNRKRIYPRYAYYMLRSAELRRVLALISSGTSGSMKNISQGKLVRVLVPLPPLDEQQRIVGLLDRAAEIRSRADAARAKARAIIPALFLDTFGDPATNPKEWLQLPFAQITDEFRYGTNQKCSDEAANDSVPVLRIPNVIGGQIDWSDIKHATLPAKEREKTRLRSGDLLFVRTNGNPDYIGRCAYFDTGQEASYASYLIRARLADAIKPAFAVHHFNHPRFRPLMLRMGKTTAGNYNLSVEGLSGLLVMVPPLPLQSAFAEQAQRLESLARHLDAAAVKAEAMAAGLSAEVFGSPASPARRDAA